MKKLAKSLAYAFYLVAIAEIALQAFYWANAGQPLWRRTALPIFSADATTGFWSKRNLDYWQRTNEYQSHIITNADGLRVAAPGITYRPGHDPSRYRVLLLGPSFAFGWGVNYDQSFAHRLETLLNDRGFAAGRHVEVINAGVPFMSSRQSFDWYERDGAGYRPDLVILFEYGSLDIAEEYGSERVVVDRDGYLVPRDGPSSGRMRDLAKRSALVFYGWRISSALQERWSAGTRRKPIEGAGRILSTHAGFQPDGPEVSKSLITYRHGRELSVASGGQFLVVSIPVAYAVHREDIARWQEVGVEDVDAQLEYDRRFCAELTRRDIACVDIAPALIAAAHGARQYYWLDGHWTPAGNATAAHAVAGSLSGLRGFHK